MIDAAEEHVEMRWNPSVARGCVPYSETRVASYGTRSTGRAGIAALPALVYSQWPGPMIPLL
jgi:hypothetical protein